jgi:cytochrome c
MPTSFYKALTPRDLDALVAYLRTVPPVRNEVVAPVYKAPQVREVYPDAEKRYTDEALRDPVIRGQYLVTLSHCMSCHSAWSKGVSDFEHGLGKGGRPFSSKVIFGLPQSWTSSVAKNITSNKEFGIGAWTDEEIKRAITHGISRDGRELQLPMPYDYFANLSNDDLNAVVAYLRTVPPLQ